VFTVLTSNLIKPYIAITLLIVNNSIFPSLPEMADIWQQTLNWQPTVHQQTQFQQLYELILEGNTQLNLTRITEPLEFWEKHLWDSVRGISFLLSGNNHNSPLSTPVAPLGEDSRVGGFPDLSELSVETPRPHWLPSSPSSPPSFIDIGTGAGFPGIPIAITVPNCTVTLLDATRKKISFIEKIQAALSLTNVKTLTGRSEVIGQESQHRQTYDIALIRAVGTASVCAEYTLPLLKQGGLAVVYRGSWTEAETASLENALNQLGGVIESIEQFTTPLSHSIRHCLYLRKIKTTPAKFPRAPGIPTQKPL